MLVDDLKARHVDIDLIDAQEMFVLFTNGTVLPVVGTFDEDGAPTSDHNLVRIIQFGSDEAGYGETQVNGITWLPHH